MTLTNQSGVTLTCTNPDCPCELRIETPCPHGDDYRCACGHRFQTATEAEGRSVGERAEAEGIVDQQAAVMDVVNREA
jgi:hypothetical protein